MANKMWLELKLCYADETASDEKMIKNLKHYGFYDNIDDVICDLLTIEKHVEDEDEV